MATRPRSLREATIHYPTRDGKPVGETPVHRDILFELVYMLRRWFEADPMAYVSGNMLMYYVEGDKRKHVSPDVFVTLGIPDDGRRRDAYFVWEEGKGPDFVVELTSKSTRREDQSTKLALYRDVLHVREYFLFDPYGEYLNPPLKGFRLVEGQYQPIEPVEGRLPSEVTGLHLEPAVEDVRLYAPSTGRHLTTSRELPNIVDPLIEEIQRLQAIARDSLDAARLWEATAQEIQEKSRGEIDQLRREMEELRRRLPEDPT
jgi:Uma2 family endonuclease